MANFGQDWQRHPSRGVSERFQGMLRKEQPLKPRVESTINGLNSPISKLSHTSKNLSEKEQRLFQRIVQAKQQGNTYVAKALANELSQIRKTNSTIGNMKLSVEKTQLRLTTVNSVGDAIVAMRPAVDTMKVVVPAMNKIMPQASAELESMGSMLGDMIPSSINDDFAFVGSEASETDSILQEAAAVAETQIGEKFPSVPTNANSMKTSVDTGY